MKIEIITNNHISMLERFCSKAKELKYINNSSLKAMKYEWCKEQGEYFCAIVNNEIVE